MWPRSPSRPSETSSMAGEAAQGEAEGDRAGAGAGRRGSRPVGVGRWVSPRSWARPRAARPGARDPQVVVRPGAGAGDGGAGGHLAEDRRAQVEGPRVVSPPMASMPKASQQAKKPREGGDPGFVGGRRQAGGEDDQRGWAPIAARSETLTAGSSSQSLQGRCRERNGCQPPACRWRWPAACRARADQRRVVAHRQVGVAGGTA